MAKLGIVSLCFALAPFCSNAGTKQVSIGRKKLDGA